MLHGQDDHRSAIGRRPEDQAIVSDYEFVVFQFGEFRKPLPDFREVFEHFGGFGNDFDSRALVEARDVVLENILKVEECLLSPNY